MKVSNWQEKAVATRKGTFTLKTLISAQMTRNLRFKIQTRTEKNQKRRRDWQQA